MISSSLIRNQYVAAFSAALTMTICGSCFVWSTPLIPRLSGAHAILQMTPTEISWMVSIVELGSLVSPFPTGRIADRWGRKLALITAAPPVIISWCLILALKTAYAFYIARVLQGYAVSVVFTVCPMYLSEIASVEARGRITALVQVMWYLGILLQFCTGSYLSYEVNVYTNLALTVLVFLFFLTQPESPHYLMLYNLQEKAVKALQPLRCGASEESIRKEVTQIREALDAEKNNNASWMDLIATAADRKILLITQVLTAVRLMSGTITISAYLGELLILADWSTIDPKTCMVFFSTVTIVTIIIATCVVDKIGRIPLLIISGVGTCLSNAAIAIFFWLQNNSDMDVTNLKWLPAVVLTLFTFFFSLGLGPVTQTIQAELFPSHLRGYGSIVSVFNMTILSFLGLRSYQIINDLFGVCTNFIIFSLVCGLGLIFTILYVPETKGKTFYEIRTYFLKHNKEGNDLEIEPKC
ncbi:hypothetical protein LSTR_LSTR006797 [Laodelphax striatellus]|uniref:Major facilitator superfamily (MFS) profile domain-containing protein n=1 Tax=Laodelphax striatellus TaxID=195883 RepID=A0A482WSQ5_LAOST|nr:hypothetical protein LSTR_LSTR006797 [Laodelphax striatellus]